MVTINEETFLTVDQAFDFALTSLMATISEKDKVRIYIWRKRYKDGKLSHKKVADILTAAGFAKVVEERWMPLDNKEVVPRERKKKLEPIDEPFKD